MPGTDEVKKDFCLSLMLLLQLPIAQILLACWKKCVNQLHHVSCFYFFKAVLIKTADSKRVPLVLAKAETETHSLLETLIKYTEYNWQVCGDFKIIALILVFSWVILNTAAL